MTKKNLLLYFTLISITFLTYSNIFQNEFLYDDEFLILKNETINSWDQLTKIFAQSLTEGAVGKDYFYRPLQNLAYLVINQTLGLKPWGFNLFNLILHCMNVILVFLLTLKLTKTQTTSIITSLLWGLHPLHVEAVTYKSATADPLYSLFLLAAFLRLCKPKWDYKTIAISCILFFLGLLSKESAIIFPALSVLAAIYFLDKKNVFKTLPFWIIACLYYVIRTQFLHIEHSFYETPNEYTNNIVVRIYTFLATVPEYFKILAWPTNLHMDRFFPYFTNFTDFPVLLGTLILCLLISSLLTKSPILIFAICWVGITHFLHTGIIIPVNSLFLEHWMYLPSIGLLIAICYYLNKFKPLLIIPLLAIGGFSFLTYEQNKVWATPLSFYSNILKFNPNAPRIHHNLGMTYANLNNFEKAVYHYEKTIELSGFYAETFHNLGILYFNMGKLHEAVHSLEKALEVNPLFAHSFLPLAKAYELIGETEKSAVMAKKYQQILQNQAN